MYTKRPRWTGVSLATNLFCRESGAAVVLSLPGSVVANSAAKSCPRPQLVNRLLCALLFALPLLAAGCCPYKIDVTATIHADGSGQQSAILALPQGEMVPALCVSSMDQIATQAAQGGATTSEWFDLKYMGKKIVQDFGDFETMSRQLGFTQGGGNLFSRVQISRGENDTILFDAWGDWSSWDQVRDMKFTLSMPGPVITYTQASAATQGMPNTVTWDLLKLRGGWVELSAMGNANWLSGIPSWVWRGGGVMAALVVLGVLLSAVIRHRPKRGVDSRKSESATPVAVYGVVLCPRCGADNSIDSQFCRECQVQLTSEALKVPAGTARAHHSDGKPLHAVTQLSDDKTKRLARISPVAGILALISGGVLGCLGMNQVASDDALTRLIGFWNLGVTIAYLVMAVGLFLHSQWAYHYGLGLAITNIGLATGQVMFWWFVCNLGPMLSGDEFGATVSSAVSCYGPVVGWLLGFLVLDFVLAGAILASKRKDWPAALAKIANNWISSNSQPRSRLDVANLLDDKSSSSSETIESTYVGEEADRAFAADDSVEFRVAQVEHDFISYMKTVHAYRPISRIGDDSTPYPHYQDQKTCYLFSSKFATELYQAARSLEALGSVAVIIVDDATEADLRLASSRDVLVFALTRRLKSLSGRSEAYYFEKYLSRRFNVNLPVVSGDQQMAATAPQDMEGQKPSGKWWLGEQ